MVENTETEETRIAERRRKRQERLANYDQTPEAEYTREKLSEQFSQPNETVEVRVEEKKPETARPKVEAKTSSKKAPTKEELATTAPVILNLANTFVITSFGPDCGMTQQEANVISPSLQRCLERLPYSAAKQASVFIDPLVLLIGLAMWGKRIIDIQDKRAKEKYQVQPTETMRANGVSGFEYQVPSKPEPEPVSPRYSTTNGVPDAIRNQENDYGVPY